MRRGGERKTDTAGMGETMEVVAAATGAANGNGGETFNSFSDTFIIFIHLFFGGSVRHDGCSGGGSKEKMTNSVAEYDEGAVS